MIKRILLSACILLIALKIINAQCTPNPAITYLIYPDSITDLPPATATIAYSATMYTAIPHDTTYSGNALTVDSIYLTNILGLPSSLTYQCNTPNCGWAGGATIGTYNHGCALISGTPTSGEVGTHNIKLATKYIVKYMGFPFSPIYDTIKNYKIVINPFSNVAIVKAEKFEVFQNKPNPFNDYTEIKFTSPLVQNINFAVINLLGQTIYSEKIKSKIGENKIIFSSINVNPGVYFYKISNENTVFIKKMTVN
ncbi:MAG: T9SS type A sorting domain-containing protein [Bacteroidales bacterium]|jgi:hypothetical protein